MIDVSKYHGCGNDFIIARYEDVRDIDLHAFITNVCNRHTGIGADGCILVKTDPLEMIFYNCDGSRAPMCGNGIRCFAKYCFDENLCRDKEMDVATLAGIKHVQRLNEKPFLVRIAMGKADYSLESIHVKNVNQPMMGYPLRIDGQTYELYSFFMSTVHTVVFVEDAFEKEIEMIGSKICHHPLFEEKTNVNFVEIVDDAHIRMQTYERGVGMTLACGTGACASALMAHKYKGCRKDILVELKKGNLQIEITSDEEVFMSGPAVCVVKGEYDETQY